MTFLRYVRINKLLLVLVSNYYVQICASDGMLRIESRLPWINILLLLGMSITSNIMTTSWNIAEVKFQPKLGRPVINDLDHSDAN